MLDHNFMKMVSLVTLLKDYHLNISLNLKYKPLLIDDFGAYSVNIGLLSQSITNEINKMKNKIFESKNIA